MKIGVIGLGAMGAGIAGNLLAAGHDVTVWNRSRGPVDALVAKGAQAAAAAADALQGDVLVSMLASDEAMRAVGLDGPLLDRAARGLVHCNMATVSIALAQELSEAHARRGLGYVSAPVFGRPNVAEAGQLLIVAAGADDALARLAPVFAAAGRRTEIVGAEPHKANLFKIAGNFMIVSVVETLGEAFALLRKGGVDHAQFQEVMAATLFAAPIYQGYGKLIVDEAFEPPGFTLRLGLKDVNLARSANAALGGYLPLGDLMARHLEEAIAAGLGEKDLTAATALIAKKAGV
ncbi:MAG TPA: NAD(P)-dependent oxidoreductase [Rhizomicrobium sp.]|jgi:3-hydroxyisobutyrate dehydrogenase-like beta-hydroxyacid dehydrogenase|nr:NAD(P)-dependent oxidoreductase [Rhizomicrobium sp.]